MAGARSDAGVLVVIVGPSGSGKDTLISWLREKLEGRPEYLFVRRTVTREADADLEDHDTMSVAQFEAAAEAGRFAVTWTAHGLQYGLPASAHDHIRRGGVAIANGSRQALPAIRKRFSRLRVIHLTVDPDILAERLAVRGRESAGEVSARLDRAAIDHDLGPDVCEVDNSGSVEEAGNRILRLIDGYGQRQRGERP